MMKMLHIFLFLFLSLSLPNAFGQTTYSFAGFAWGDTIEIVEKKLKTHGLSSCESGQKTKCKILTTCSCTFKGRDIKIGIAAFNENRLVSVWISVVDPAATRQALKEKYGTPLPRRDVSHLSLWEQSEETLTSRWRSESGESLEINSEGILLYNSAIINNQKETARRNQRSKF